MKEFDVNFANQNIKDAYLKLASGKYHDKELHKAISNAIENLKINPEFGTKIPQRLIPKFYKTNYNADNLWKYNLPKAWRLIYTLTTDEVKIISIILVSGCNAFDNTDIEVKVKQVIPIGPGTSIEITCTRIPIYN